MKEPQQGCSPRKVETPLPIKPVSAPGGDAKCTSRKAVALPVTAIVAKQEGEKREVELLICERVVETEVVTQTQQGATEDAALESAAERTGKFIKEWPRVRFTN